jgi:hypothetical protein
MELWLVLVAVIAIAFPLYVLLDVDARTKAAFDLNYRRLIAMSAAADARYAELRREISDLRRQLEAKQEPDDDDAPPSGDVTESDMTAIMDRLFPAR